MEDLEEGQFGGVRVGVGGNSSTVLVVRKERQIGERAVGSLDASRAVLKEIAGVAWTVRGGSWGPLSPSVLGSTRAAFGGSGGTARSDIYLVFEASFCSLFLWFICIPDFSG